MPDSYADPSFHIGRNTARAIVIHEGKILLMERWRADEHYFSIPGGKIEPDETPEQAVVREIKEETSLTVTLDRLVYVWEEGTHTHYFYLCNYVSGEVHLPESSEEAKKGAQNRFKPGWVKLGDLSNLPFGYWVPVSRQLVTDVVSGMPLTAKLIGA